MACYPSFRHRSASRHARLLLVLGIFAVFMHTLAGMGLMGSHAGKPDTDGNFVAGICTVLGVSNVHAAQTDVAGNSQQPAGGNTHDCCKLCVASSPLLFASTSLAVSPAPTFRVTLAPPLPARPASLAWTAHPPRGPPASV